MASEKILDCVILGLLSHEALTGYEIKKRIDISLKYFWRASYGSIYPTLNELTRQGLVSRKDCSENKRGKQLYSITDAGRDYLKEWLRLPAQRDELRCETLLKVFFGKEEGNEQAITHIAAFQEKIEAELPYLLQAEKTLESCPDSTDTSHMHYLLTVKFGIKTCAACLEWCREAKESLL